jgi:hypothetical protein
VVVVGQLLWDLVLAVLLGLVVVVVVVVVILLLLFLG